MDHHVGDGELLKIEQAAEHVAIRLDHAAFAMQQVDRAAQFLVAGEDVLGRVQTKSEQPQEPAHDRLDCERDRTEQACERPNRLGYDQREAIRTIDRNRLRHDLGKYDDDCSHQKRRIGDTRIAEPAQEQAGRNGRRGNIDEIVAEQNRANQALAHLHEAVDEGSAMVPAVFERRHPRARGGRQRRLTARKEKREKQA